MWPSVDLGGFLAWPMDTLRWYVVGIGTNLDDAYREPGPIVSNTTRNTDLRLSTAPSTSFLTVTLHDKTLRNPSPGNFEPAVPRTLATWT